MAVKRVLGGARRDGVVVGPRPWWRRPIDRFVVTTPARIAIAVFTGLILVTTLLLALPISSADRTWTPLADALFTATSTICVTGLATLDMATHWSPFGNAVILVGMHVGGIGVLTLASILGLVVSRRLGLQQRLTAASDLNPSRIHAGPVAEAQAVRLGEVGSLLGTIVVSLLTIELVITALIVPRLLVAGVEPLAAVYQGFYYATSAFTNTGFVPTPEGLAPYAGDVWMLSVLALAVFLGSVGFPVIFGLARRVKRGTRLTLHVKLTLTTTLLLIVAGAGAIFLLEFDNPATLGAEPLGSRGLTAAFTSVMTRSGGLSTIDMAETNGSTKLVMDMLMFVGGGSASTAGGIKVTTLAVLFLAAFAEAKGDRDMQAFGRRVPQDVLRLGVSVVLWGATIVATSSVVLLHLTKAPLDIVLFDVISAFATCGLSVGLPGILPDAGVYVLAATMWAGRVGTVTLAAALAASQRGQLYTRPEERPIVG
jgi:trk system potassium uptake protein